MLSTDKQTNQCYQKHNLLCQGGNNILQSMVFGMMNSLLGVFNKDNDHDVNVQEILAA